MEYSDIRDAISDYLKAESEHKIYEEKYKNAKKYLEISKKRLFKILNYIEYQEIIVVHNGATYRVSRQNENISECSSIFC